MPKKKAQPRNSFVTIALTAREKQVLEIQAERYGVITSVLCRRVLAVAIRRLQALQQERAAQEAAAAAPTAPE